MVRHAGNYYGATLGLGRDAGQGDLTVFTVQVLNEPASIAAILLARTCL